MCLYTNSRRPSVTKKDIVCYKVLNKTTNDKYSDFYLTPYAMYLCKIGDDIKSLRPMDKLVMSEEYTTRCCIADQGVHAWRDAVKAFSTLTDKRVIVKAIIPKGTKYCIGDGRDIAAERIILDHIMTKEEIDNDINDYFNGQCVL